MPTRRFVPACAALGSLPLLALGLTLRLDVHGAGELEKGGTS